MPSRATGTVAYLAEPGRVELREYDCRTPNRGSC